MQERYYAAHLNNIVRVVFGKTDPSDSPQNNVYTRAAAYLKEWRASGILQQLPEPALFVYFQRFTIPDQKELHLRKGFVGLGRLEDYANKVVFPHERTLTGPKQDRLELLRQTRTQFERRSLFKRAAVFLDAAESSYRDRVSIGVFTDGRLSFLRLKVSLDLRLLMPNLSERQRALDVVILHRLIFEKCLGITEEA